MVRKLVINRGLILTLVYSVSKMFTEQFSLANWMKTTSKVRVLENYNTTYFLGTFQITDVGRNGTFAIKPVL